MSRAAPLLINDATTLLAGDAVIDEVFGSFPLVVTGGALGAFGQAYLKKLADVEVPIPAAALGAAVVFTLLAKAGILNAAAGGLAKLMLDVWNVFAGLVLKGAYLKYQ